MQAPQSYGQPPQPQFQQPQSTRVVVTDIDMKFTTMIVFMIKWAIAAIPATLILSIIMGAVLGVLFVILGAIGLVGAAATH